MIVHASEHYPHFGVYIIPYMCPNLNEHMVPNNSYIIPWDLNWETKNWQKSVCFSLNGKIRGANHLPLR